MRARHWLCCLAVLGVCLVGSMSAQEAVEWQPTLETAKRVASQTGRLVLIHFWGDGCRPCQVMDREVYSRADVAAVIARDFVAVKVNQSHFPASASQYGVSAVPTDVIISPQGQLVARHAGAVPASQYMSRLNQLATNWRRSSQAGRYASNASSPPQGPAGASTDARSAYQQSPQAARGAPYTGQPAVTGPASGFAARADQQPVQGPPAMGSRYIGGAAASDPNRRFAAGTSQPPTSSYGREALQPTQSAYSPPLGNNAAAAASQRAPVGAPYPDQQPHSNQQPPNSGLRTWAPATSHPGAGLATQSPSFEGSNRQPSPAAEPAPGIPAGNPPVALDGYCPVQLTEKER